LVQIVTPKIARVLSHRHCHYGNRIQIWVVNDFSQFVLQLTIFAMPLDVVRLLGATSRIFNYYRNFSLFHGRNDVPAPAGIFASNRQRASQPLLKTLNYVGGCDGFSAMFDLFRLPRMAAKSYPT
jgi:hypothetical protein